VQASILKTELEEGDFHQRQTGSRPAGKLTSHKPFISKCRFGPTAVYPYSFSAIRCSTSSVKSFSPPASLEDTESTAEERFLTADYAVNADKTIKGMIHKFPLHTAFYEYVVV
jgi:hypothetical protein